MAEPNFQENLLRAIAAELHLQTGLQIAREMFGKSYFALGFAEKVTVDQTAWQMVAANYQGLTPESLAQQQKQQPVGFQAPSPPPQPKAES